MQCFYSKKIFFIPLFLWRKEKRQKKHPPTPIPSLYGGAQPLLLVARSLKYAQGIKALAWFFVGLRQVVGDPFPFIFRLFPFLPL